MLQGTSGIRRISLFDPTKLACQIAGEVTFRPSDFLHPKEIKRMDRFIQFAMVAGQEALTHSGLNLESEDRTRVGSCVGVGIGGLTEIERQCLILHQQGPRRVSPFFIPMVISNLAAGQLSIRYGLQGPNFCTTSACSSSAHALGESFRMIQHGEADVMLAGGAEAAICELGIAGFCALRALSERNREPERASRPFDSDRDGFVMGEGAALFVLEEWEHAKKRGATLCAELMGYGRNCDAFHITQPSEKGQGAAACMQLALKDAKLNALDVDYINAHGTSTPLGDEQEIMAIKTVFGQHAYELAVSSTKSMTGHLLGAAGALEALVCVQSLQHQVVPPTVNLENPSPGCDLNLVPLKPQERKVHVALSNSFGFGGTNASLILRYARE